MGTPAESADVSSSARRAILTTLVEKLRKRTAGLLVTRRGATDTRGLRPGIALSRPRGRDTNKGARMAVIRRTPPEIVTEAAEGIDETAESERKVRAALERNRVLGRGVRVGKAFKVQGADGTAWYEITLRRPDLDRRRVARLRPRPVHGRDARGRRRVSPTRDRAARLSPRHARGALRSPRLSPGAAPPPERPLAAYSIPGTWLTPAAGRSKFAYAQTARSWLASRSGDGPGDREVVRACASPQSQPRQFADRGRAHPEAGGASGGARGDRLGAVLGRRSVGHDPVRPAVGAGDPPRRHPVPAPEPSGRRSVGQRLRRGHGK